ncbi:unnamed protein product [Cladocopium goreaui]|uniref:Rhamnose biosynthetic enzyme 1 n=1 Tax=Cladocopium goreaui TaxID=2562237 RepID=A0A9P1CDJ1_9DINO|nr:unnamed protein product [Cladocopium goreaui]
MAKNTVIVSRRDAKRKVKRSKDEMVFPKPSGDISSRDPRQRNLSHILAGLKHLKAPIAGRKAIGLDLEIGGPSMDMATDLGFSNSLFQVANLRAGGGALAAPVCGSWVFLSRGSTGRTRTNPMGDSSCRSTRLGNLLTARTLILLWVLAAKGCWWIVEQPSSSLMEFHVLFQRFLSLIRVRRLSICMADYGSPTLKPTYLYSSHHAIDMLPDYQSTRRLVDREMVRRYTNGAGESRICGGRDLKSSQAYPKGFGVALAKCRTAVQKKHLKLARQFLRAARASTNKVDTQASVNKAWTKGAQLESVIQFLSH